jgi:DNA-binding MarR family transcriptional regulator
LTAEGVVGAVLGVLHARLSGAELSEDGSVAVAELLGPLMGIVVLPYLGNAAAVRESSREASPRPRTAPLHGDPLRELDMRLTYRTVRVLLAIASDPGASNRRIADAAGIADQGQISKLLTRLEHLGLIANARAAQTRGEPNHWTLTDKGHEVKRTLQRQGGLPAAS